MSAALNGFDLALLRGRNWGHLAVNGSDGYPHVTVVWVDTDGENVLVNSAMGRVKDRAVQRDSKVSISVHDQDQPLTFVSIRGDVISRETDESAQQLIDTLSRKYDGEPWEPIEGQVRVTYRIRPERIIRHT